MKENLRDDLLRMNLRKCPVCGKEYWAGLEWVYKRGYEKSLKYFCSWGCLRKDEKEKGTGKQELGRQIRLMLESGATNEEIKKKLGCTQGQIDYRRGIADYERTPGRKKSSRKD